MAACPWDMLVCLSHPHLEVHATILRQGLWMGLRWPVTKLPLPVPDPERPWGNTSCLTCKDFCAGHYKKNFLTDVLDTKAMKLVAKPPSIALKMFSSDVVVTEFHKKYCSERIAALPRSADVA